VLTTVHNVYYHSLKPFKRLIIKEIHNGMANPKVVVYMDPKTLDKLDQMASRDYRGESRGKVIQWIIDDMWEMKYPPGEEEYKELG
jgi:hypothetical protein